MKITILTASVALIALAWLGVSFSTPAFAGNEYFPDFEQMVSADHGDSHRLGEVVNGEVPLPEASSEVAVGEDFAFIAAK